MKEFCFSRRRLLVGTCELSIAAAFVFLTGCTRSPGNASACVDAAQLSEGESSLRTSLQYVDDSPNDAQACSGCAYFHAAQGNGCGSCTILTGTVNSGGHCTSWSSKT